MLNLIRMKTQYIYCAISIFSRVSAHGRLKFTGHKNRGGCLHREAICTYNVYTCEP